MLSTIAALALLGQAQEMRLMRYPAIHGDKIVFTYGSDLWLADRGGGFARRLTTHPGDEIRAKFSPDGKWIAFSASYDGTSELYVMPSEGGEPKRLTYSPGSEFALSWTPEGKIAFASGYGNPIPFTAMLYTISPDGGTPAPTKLYEVVQGTPSPDGSSFAYNRRGSYNYNWRRYRGGVQGQVSLFNFRTGDYSELPSGRENSWFPMWIGDSIYYVSDRNQGTVNLYRHDLKSKRDTQLTRYADGDIKWPSTDGKSIVWERDGYLVIYDIASNKEQSFAPKVMSDKVQARPQLRRLANQISRLDISPSGNRVVVEARGEIFSVPVKAGETRNLTDTDSARERTPSWSPDGQKIAYFSDATGESQLYIEPQTGGPSEQVTSVPSLFPASLSWSPDGKYLVFNTRDFALYVVDVAAKKLTQVASNKGGDFVNYDISPDSKWIAYTDSAPNQNQRVLIYDIAAGKATPVTDGFYNDESVAFDQSGKYLYFVSNRSFSPAFGLYEFSLKVTDSARLYMLPLSKETTNPLIPPADEEPETKPAAPATPPSGPPAPKPTQIDFDGLADRAIVLPPGAGSYFLVAGANEGVFYVTGNTLMKFDLKSREAQTILTAPGGGQALAFNPSRSKMAYMTGGTVYVVDVRPGLQPGQGAVSMAAVETVVDPEKEWRQMFWEAWRYERDYFYDAAMVGVDWNAVGKKYEKFLPYVSDRSDMGYILGLMIGELGTGHAYVQGFGSPPPNPVNQGLLGADYEVASGHVRIKKVIRGGNYDERGPLADAGLNVNDGDYLLEIDGKAVDAKRHPNELLLGKAGRTVVVTVNSRPSMEGARKLRVVAAGSEDALRYHDWVEENRKKVDRMSGGRIGYMHIPNTSTNGAIELIRGFYSQWNKEAVLVDERFNGGGYVQPWFVDTLVRRIRAGMRARYGDDQPDARAIEGPRALLINEYAGSGGDLFPWMFRQAKVGPLIGKRTWGGLVGIRGGIPLLDGGSVTAPEFGLYDREQGKWIAENTGVDPDIEVDNRPDLLAQGKDPQLEKGVEYLLNELKKTRPGAKRPDFPKTVPPPGR